MKSKTPLSEPSLASFVVAPSIFAVIPAGGVGSRLAADRPKQYLALVGRSTMLEVSARKLLDLPWISKVVVVVAPGDPFQKAVHAILHRSYGARVEFLCRGGATRRDTVMAGLTHLKASCAKKDRSWVMVHDAARPGLDALSLERLKVAVLADPNKSGGLLALPLADTVKRMVPSKKSSPARSAETLDRSQLWAAQTPQMFPLDKLRRALQTFSEVTDEASAIEQMGGKPLLIPGSSQNFKVTSAEDLSLMRAYLKGRALARG